MTKFAAEIEWKEEDLSKWESKEVFYKEMREKFITSFAERLHAPDFFEKFVHIREIDEGDDKKVVRFTVEMAEVEGIKTMLFESADKDIVVYDDNTISIEGKLFAINPVDVIFTDDMADNIINKTSCTLFDLVEMKHGTVIMLNRILVEKTSITTTSK